MASMGLVAYSDLLLACQRRADMENSSFVGANEWLQLINSSCAQLWEKLVEAYGSDYEVQTAFSITTDGTNDHYALPTDFFKLLGVDLSLQNPATSSGYVSVWRFNFASRNQFTLPNIQTLWGRTNLKYRLSGGQIWFIPLPASGQNLRLWYAPRFTPYALPTDTCDWINGWEEWAINDVAIKARAKEQTPCDDLRALKAEQEERLTHVTENRDAGQPGVTVDSYGANGGWSSNGWGDWEP